MSHAPKVAVVGGGAPAWLAAASLARALRHRAVQVTVIDTGATESPAGDWTLPSSRGMHRLLGMNEGDFLRATGSSFRLGSEHQGWQGDGSGFVHSHGSIGKEMNGIPFYKLLLSRRMAGDRIPADIFSVASAALRMGRFARPEGDDHAMTASFTYGYHLRLPAYAALVAGSGPRQWRAGNVGCAGATASRRLGQSSRRDRAVASALTRICSSTARVRARSSFRRWAVMIASTGPQTCPAIAS